MAILEDFYPVPRVIGDNTKEFDCLVELGGGGDYTTINTAWDAGNRRIRLGTGTHELTGNLVMATPHDHMTLVGNGTSLTTIDKKGYDLARIVLDSYVPAQTAKNAGSSVSGMRVSGTKGDYTLTITTGSADFTGLEPYVTTLVSLGFPYGDYVLKEVVNATTLIMTTPLREDYVDDSTTFVVEGADLILRDLTLTSTLAPIDYESYVYNDGTSGAVATASAGGRLMAERVDFRIESDRIGDSWYLNYDSNRQTGVYSAVMIDCITDNNFEDYYGSMRAENCTIGHNVEAYEGITTTFDNCVFTETCVLNTQAMNYIHITNSTFHDDFLFPQKNKENLIVQKGSLYKGQTIEMNSMAQNTYGEYISDGYRYYSDANIPALLEYNTGTYHFSNSAYGTQFPTSSHANVTQTFSYIRIIKNGTGTLTLSKGSHNIEGGAGPIVITTPGKYEWLLLNQDWIRTLG